MKNIKTDQFLLEKLETNSINNSREFPVSPFSNGNASIFRSGRTKIYRLVEGLEVVAKSLGSPASAADIPSAEENSKQSRVGGGG